METIMSRYYWPPTHETFKIKPIKELLDFWLPKGDDKVIIDPFAKDAKYGTITNDIDPNTSAQYHLEASDFLRILVFGDIKADAMIWDPPYTARQISECYQAAGRLVTKRDTQLARVLSEAKEVALKLLPVGSVVISFGYNSGGFGTTRGFEKLEIRLIYMGGAHYDIICVVEKRIK